MERRHFLQRAGLASILAPLYGFINGSASTPFPGNIKSNTVSRKIHIFSKHLHWLDFETMASFVAECGFDGSDITVRKDGHVEPERVADDLPRVVEALRKAGKEVTLITTSILRADEPHTETILKTAGRLGIQYYRLGWYAYDTAISIDDNLKLFEKHLRGLVKLNQQYNIRGSYQNHAGASLGSPVWDFARMLHTLNSPWIGCQYDVRHATVEGANSWPLGFGYIKQHINSLDVKDFVWTIENGKWKPENVPLGQGMVDFEKYFKLVSTLPSSIPMCLHMEYPLGGAEHGNKTISIRPEEIKKAMMKDLAFLRERV